MNLLDIVIVVILAYCLIRGIFRGLIKELSSIVGVMAAFYAAYTYYPELAHLLGRWISDQGYRRIFSFMIVFSIIFILISILGVIIKYLMNIAYLGWIDRICGAAFGSIKGLLIISVLLLALTSFLPSGSPLLKNSLLAPHIVLISEKLAKLVPPDMKRQFKKGIHALRRAGRADIETTVGAIARSSNDRPAAPEKGEALHG
jgi:membrane protein required for colicin V production